MDREKRIHKASDKYLADSKKRFTDILERKMKTTFIGALSEFERKFGFLWGDKNYTGNMKNDSGIHEDIWREMWSEARDRILTNGNNQFKAMLSELENNTICWDQYRLEFKNFKGGRNE
jgi:vacuolar-type H+-ATPase subunit H